MSESSECSEIEGNWLRREEASGSRRQKIKGSSSQRKDPEGRQRLEVLESCLVRSHGCSVTFSIPEPGNDEQTVVRTPASLQLL